MSRTYATTDDGRKVLYEVTCDGCHAVLKPGPHVVDSGWEKRTWRNGPGNTVEWHYCPDCKETE